MKMRPSIAAGWANNAQASKNYFALARYNTNGTLDTTFGGKAKGKVTSDFGSTGAGIYYLSILADDRILTIGQSDNFVTFARYSSSACEEAEAPPDHRRPTPRRPGRA